MKALLKIFAWLAAALLLVGAAVIVAIALLVHPDDYRGAITAAVQSRTGRTLNLEGRLALDLFPCCSITVGRAELGNPPGFPAEPFVRLESAELGIRLWPLILHRELEIGKLRLDKVEARLVRRRDGAVNWQFEAPGSGATGAGGTGAGGAAGLFSVAGIAITGSSLEWRDETTGSDYRLDDVNVETGAITTSSPRQVALTNLVGTARVDGLAGGGTATLGARIRRIDVDTGNLGGAIDGLEGHLEAAGLALELSGNGPFGKTTGLAGDIRCRQFSPRQVLAALHKPVPVTADNRALTALAGSARWFLRGTGPGGGAPLEAGLEEMDLKLDDTRVTGSLRRSPGNTPANRFRVQLDAIDLDRYLGPEPARDRDGTKDAGKASQEPPTPLPLDTLRALRLEGGAAIGRLKVEGVQLADVTLTVAANGGQVQVAPLRAKLYGGTWTGQISLDATGPRARLAFDQSFDNVEIGGLLSDFADVRNLSGRMDSRLHGTATGNDDSALKQALGGTVSFSLANGVYRGLDVWHEIRKARALVRRQPPPAPTGPDETPINTLELAGHLADGRLMSDRFVAEIPFLRLTGDLAFDVPAKALDAKLEANIYEKPVFPDGTDLGDLQNVRIPLTVSGPLQSPKVRVDMARLVREAATQAAKEELRDKVLKKLGLGGTEPAAEPGAEPQAEPKKKEDPLKKALDRLFKP